MNREIKFRAWDIVSLRIIDDYITVREDGHFIGHTISLTENIPMQYTGLKDKKGKEIYEGDIVKLGDRNYKIVFSDYAASFMRETPIGYLRYSINEYECGNAFEVIGNIYENPELLK